MKDVATLSKIELRIELKLQQASADVAWRLAESLVEKVAKLEKLLAEATSKEDESST